MTRQELQGQLLRATKARAEKIGRLHDEMQRINTEYDMEARRIHKLIAELDAETTPEPKPARKRASREIPLPEGDELAKLIERYGK